MICLNPRSRACSCPFCAEEKSQVSLCRSSDNSLARWMNSNRWTEISQNQKIRGECVERWISSKGPTKITRFVVNGEISGTIDTGPSND
jgi:sarcosine oxidase delta subunit